MREAGHFIWALITGVGLGLVFFGGLWFTVKKGLVSKLTPFLFMASFLVRTGIILLGFYVVSAGNWQRLVFCLIGFTIARIMVKRFIINKKKIIYET